MIDQQVLGWVLGVLFVLFYKHRSHYTGANLPPGTIRYSVFGETLKFLSSGQKGCLEKFIFHRMDKFKTEVFKTSLVGEPAAVFCSAACNKLLFSNENKLVTPWWPSSMNKLFPLSLQTSFQSEAKNLRKLLPRVLKPEVFET